jgi:hypothetical protein
MFLDPVRVHGLWAKIWQACGRVIWKPATDNFEVGFKRGIDSAGLHENQVGFDGAGQLAEPMCVDQRLVDDSKLLGQHKDYPWLIVADEVPQMIVTSQG